MIEVVKGKTRMNVTNAFFFHGAAKASQEMAGREAYESRTKSPPEEFGATYFKHEVYRMQNSLS
jgi:hypothetical protein